MDKLEHRSALRAELVKLIIHQETIFSNWIRFAITVQGGLVAGLAFVLRYVPNDRVVLGFIIAFFGAATALFVCKNSSSTYSMVSVVPARIQQFGSHFYSPLEKAKSEN